MGSQKERMLRGDLYLADDPELAEDREGCRLAVERYNRTSVTEESVRQAILPDLLGAVGEGVEIRPPIQLDYGYQTSIGAHTFINFGVVILDVARVTIGSHVQIATNVQLLTPTHPLDPDERRTGLESAEPITIGDDVWLGGGVIVCPGVSIGEGAVIGAGSVVVSDLPPRALAVGNPARIVRTL